ncbi:MAG: AAA domain-containing protein [Syntrophotaleaceae bacterium]
MSIADQILSSIKENPGQKARDLAVKLGLDKKEINSFLYGKLNGKVWQDKSYRWYPTDSAQEGPRSADSTPLPKINTPLSRLCRYYLEALSQDESMGVSTFAYNQYGDPDYVELDQNELFDCQGGGFFSSEKARKLYGRVRKDRGRLSLYLGYPTRLRQHTGKKGWSGFFVEPIFLFPFEFDPTDKHELPHLSGDLPHFNFKALSYLTGGGAGSLMEEAIFLAEELGLNNPQEDLPEADDVFLKIRQLRAEWDWLEDPDPHHLHQSTPLSEIKKQGIYNRAILLFGERSPYTQGLESELKKLSETPEGVYANTALGQWLDGAPVAEMIESPKALLEVLSLNLEQREAINRALVEPLTVITGPPGTGKSQVVTNLLINAAWQGQRVLFASKNNKAVDVVEARVNGLGSRPVLLRMGSNEYQGKLAEYLVQLLAATSTAEQQAEYEECLACHKSVLAEFAELDRLINQTMEARNTVDRLERAVAEYREQWGQDLFTALRELDSNAAGISIQRYQSALTACRKEKQPLISRLFWFFKVKERLSALAAAIEEQRQLAATFKIPVSTNAPSESNLPLWRKFGEEMASRIASAREVKDYFDSLAILQKQPSMECLAGRQLRLTQKMAGNSERLWQNWVKLQPSRISQQDRRLLSEYASVLQMMVGESGSNARADRSVYRRYYELFPKVSHMLPCWAVTSLSAHNKVPFEPSFFDLLVIDEASQCDIASALPLLFRAKRVVIIGDPKQLSHISTISMRQDKQLLGKHGILDGHASWGYSANSLFNLASGLARPEDIVALKDHHRSHAQIIDFSNRFFYEGNLRVATRYDRLKPLNDGKPAVRWTHHAGTVRRPTNGGAVNESEAKALVAQLRDLMLTRGYPGTVGVVTPFRAQANKIRELVHADDTLATRLFQAEFLVDTVHKFQGDERDVMFFSPVVSQGISQGALGFLKNTGNLFNVAITRARSLLQVVGDRQAALDSGVDYLASFADYTARLSSDTARKTDVEQNELGPDYPPVTYPERVSDWERDFYKALYAAGLRPIPQYDVEQYALDFALLDDERKLNIEVDGERYHRNWNGELCRRDQIRNQRLIELGWEVKRFWVYEIRDEMEVCVKWVKDWLKRK